MPISRYQNDQVIGRTLSSAKAHKRIRLALQNGDIPTRQYISKEGERLDILAGRVLGDGRLWWVIAICSNIGWALQVPPGIRLRIPMNLGDVSKLV